MHYPKEVERTSFVIEVNAKGQTSKVRSVQHSHDRSFDALVAGNVVQTFVRTADGKAVAGVFRMTYDYNPKTKRVKRTVTLIEEGGVDPDAPSLVDRMVNSNRLTSDQIEHDLQAAAQQAKQAKKSKPTPKPTPKPSPAATQ